MTTPKTKLGKLFIISGPSQVGKDTIVQRLRRDRTLKLVPIVTNTTRAKRPGERSGIELNFLNLEQFKALLERDELLEWATVRGAQFGTPKQSVLDALRCRQNIIMNIDVQGAQQVKAKLPDTVLIFITAESPAEVRRRIFASTKMTAEQKASRWVEAQRELKAIPCYQYVVVNRFGQLNTTLREVRRIIRQEVAQTATA